MPSIVEILLRAKGGDQVKNEMGKANKAAKESNKIFSALGAMLSVGLLAKGISSSIKAYGVQELAVTKLNAALKAQQVFTTDLSKDFQDQASALQQLTIFGDEAILAGQAFAMSMGVTAETVQKITPVVLDFASAMGIDLQTAFRVVGQAASGDTGMLKRYGIIVDQAALASDGFNAVIATMQKNFEGTAEAVAKSGIGPMEQFKNLMGDFQEDIGGTVIPVINKLIELYMELGGSLQNIEVEKRASNEKKLKKFMEDTTIELWKRQHVEMLIQDASEEMAFQFVNDELKKQQAVKDTHKIKVENSKAWEERLRKEAEKEAKLREKAVETEAKQIEETYNFRRELRELNLEEVIDAIERELLIVGESEDRKKALHKALDNYKKELRVDEAVQIEALNDKISELFVNGTKDWEGAWLSFRDYIVDFILKDIADQLVKTIGLGAALKGVVSAVTGGIGGGLLSVLGFQHGGIVPGAIGQPVPVIAHGGEKFIPPGRTGNESGGRSVQFIFNINGGDMGMDETKTQRFFRQKIYPEMQRMLRKTGEQFSGK